MTSYVSIRAVAAHHGVSPSTIRRWCANGWIPVHHRTLGWHRRFEAPQSSPAENHPPRQVVGYARVSSHDQKEDLTRQAERLLASGCDQVFKDIGSGLNCRKPGLRQLLRGILQGRFDVVRVVHEDRLLRFGVDLVRLICRHADTRLEVLEVRPSVSFEAELARDVITLMTVFCARLYGKRSHRNKAAGARRSPSRGMPTSSTPIRAVM